MIRNEVDVGARARVPTDERVLRGGSAEMRPCTADMDVGWLRECCKCEEFVSFILSF